MVGTGPYYMSLLNPGTSYTLKASPAYAQNPGCTGTGCTPAVGQYAGRSPCNGQRALSR